MRGWVCVCPGGAGTYGGSGAVDAGTYGGCVTVGAVDAGTYGGVSLAGGVIGYAKAHDELRARSCPRSLHVIGASGIHTGTMSFDKTSAMRLA